jgi:hypothetical protein
MQPASPQTARIALALGLAYAVWLGNGLYLEAAARNSASLYWALDLLPWIVLPGALWTWLSQVGVRAEHIGFARHRGHWLQLVGETASVFLSAGVLFFVVRAVARLYFPGSHFNIGHVFPDEGLLRHAAWLYAASTAGLVESALFLGLPWLLWRNQRTQGWPAAVFVLAVSTLFGLVHWELGMPIMLGAFATHAVCCAWFFHYRSLWPIAISHVLVDLIAFW